MSKIAHYLSINNPDMFFAIKFKDEDYERGKALALDGWNAWWASDGDDEYWGLGWEEGATMLLDEAGIDYEIIDHTDNLNENDGWPLWFDPNTITDNYAVFDKI